MTHIYANCFVCNNYLVKYIKRNFLLHVKKTIKMYFKTLVVLLLATLFSVSSEINLKFVNTNTYLIFHISLLSLLFNHI